MNQKGEMLIVEISDRIWNTQVFKMLVVVFCFFNFCFVVLAMPDSHKVCRYPGDILACLKDKQYGLVLEHINEIKKRFIKVLLFLFPILIFNLVSE